MNLTFEWVIMRINQTTNRIWRKNRTFTSMLSVISTHICGDSNNNLLNFAIANNCRSRLRGESWVVCFPPTPSRNHISRVPFSSLKILNSNPIRCPKSFALIFTRDCGKMNGYAHHVDSLDVEGWTDLIDYSSLFNDAATPPGDYWNPPPPAQKWDCPSIVFVYRFRFFLFSGSRIYALVARFWLWDWLCK